MSQDNKSWEEALEYKFPLLGENENKYRELKDFIHSTLNKEREEERNRLIEKMEEMKQDEKLEENDPETAKLLTEIYGNAKTPKYLQERRHGFNLAISHILTILKEDSKN